MPRQWRVVERAGQQHGAVMMPYPVLHPEDAGCYRDRRFLLEPSSKRYSKLKRYTDLQPVCRACPLQAACAEWGIAHEGDWGMFGGLTPDERAQVRKDRQQLLVEPTTAYLYDMGDNPHAARLPEQTEND